MGKHKRREGYWQLYDLSRSTELPAIIDALIRLVEEAGDPWPRARRGRPPVHSPRKMAVLAALTVMLAAPYRDMETLLRLLKLPWPEPIPDHSTLHEASLPTRTGRLPSPASGGERGALPRFAEAGGVGEGPPRSGRHGRGDGPVRDGHGAT